MLNHGPSSLEQQNTGVHTLLDEVFFLSPAEWEKARDHEKFDFVVIGSGFCAFAFVERALKNDPHARILIIERGPLVLPDHLQNLPLPYHDILSQLPEIFPWNLSPEMHHAPGINWQRGITPFFGGRSTIWSGWCPRPAAEDLQEWPPEVSQRLNDYFKEAEELLHVVSAGEINRHATVVRPGGRPIYGKLQESLTQMLQENMCKIPSVTRVQPAPLAVAALDPQGTDFHKFSTPAALLSLLQKQRRLAKKGEGAPLKIVTNCVAQKLLHLDGEANALATSRGMLPLGEAQVILAMGTLPVTTLVMNSFPGLKNAGSRYSAHFTSSLVARVPRADFPFHDALGDLELGAIYVAGTQRKTQGQYHIQLSALTDTSPEENAAITRRYMPDSVATASSEQLMASTSHVLFVCAMLGELDHRNTRNRVVYSEDCDDPTSNIILNVVHNDQDRAVWNAMEEGAFQMLEQVLSPEGPGRVEYWCENRSSTGSWEHRRPTTQEMRSSAVMHEGSTLWIGNDSDPGAVVGLDYRPRGLKNIYITGGSLWPTAGSWNPTLAMVALAQHLADTLTHASSIPNHNKNLQQIKNINPPEWFHATA